MKQINIHFTDSEHALLRATKKDRSWHDYIMTLVNLRDIKLMIANAPDFEGLAYNEAIEEYDEWLKELRNYT